MEKRRLVIVEIGAAHVAIARFGLAGDRLAVESHRADRLDPDASHGAQWADAVAAALGRLVEKRDGGDCVLIVPGHCILVKPLPAPADPGLDVAEHIPLPLDEVIWDRLTGAKGEGLLVAGRRAAIEELHAAVESVGLEVQQIIAGPLALAGTGCDAADNPRSTLLVSIGARSATVTLQAAGTALLRTIALGGNSVTRAIANGLGIEFARAETLKLDVSRGTSDLPPESALRVVVQRLAVEHGRRLADEIRGTLARWQRESGVAVPSRVFLAGGAANLVGIREALERELGVPVGRFDPGKDVAGVEAEAGGVTAEMVHAARSLLVGRARLPSLLPQAARQAQAARRRQPLQLAAGLLLVVGLLAALNHVRSEAKRGARGVGQLQGEISALKLSQARNAALLRQVEEVRQRKAQLRPADAARASWVEFLNGLQERLAVMQDVWLDRLQIVPSSGAPGGAQQRLRLSGGILPVERAGQSGRERADALLTSLGSWPRIAAVEGERFESNSGGCLRFDLTLVLNSDQPL